MLKDFKNFVLRGNVVDLAVGVVIGVAFNSVITAIVKDFITPLIAAIYHQNQFQNASFTWRGSHFLYGDAINAFISFLAIAIIVFFLVVQPINKLVALSKKNKTSDEPDTKKCPECLSVIPRLATRCAYCTAVIKTTKK